MANSNEKKASMATILVSKPFRQGVADYHAGKWTERLGRWRNINADTIYETGRLVAAVTGAQKPTLADFMAAYRAGAFPPIIS